MLALAALALAAADPWSAMQASEERIASVAWRMQTRAVRLCQKTVPLTGMVLHDRAQYNRSERATVEQRLGLAERPTVLAVVPGSPAAVAGLRVGDVLMAAANQSIAITPDKASGYAPLGAAETVIETVLAGGPAPMRFRRDGREIAISIAPVAGCRSRVQIIAGSRRNAHADGTYVQLTQAMITETRDDDELAFVIGHELAHNILEHAARLNRIGRKTSNIRTTEIEADKMAVRLMHVAGYNPSAAPRFWARMGKSMGLLAIFAAGTHLRTKPRVAMLEATVREVLLERAE